MIARQKPFRAAVLCLVCLLLPALPLAAQGDEDGYVELGDISFATCSLYLPSVEVREHYSGDYVVGWIRFVFIDDARATEYAIKGVTPHHGMYFYAANPKARQTQTISYTIYDKEGRSLDSRSRSFNQFMWEECIPGSANEGIWEALMTVYRYIQQL